MRIMIQSHPQPLCMPKLHPQSLLFSKLKIIISQMMEQQLSPLKNPKALPPHPQSLFPQPVAAKSLIFCLHILFLFGFDLYYVHRLVWLHVFCTKSHFWTELSKFVILSKTPEKIQKLILGSLRKIKGLEIEMTKRRLFVTGDVHGWHDICKLNKDNFLVGNTLCKDDILIICGDAGIIWDGMVNDA